jgi:hypothetical protein
MFDDAYLPIVKELAPNDSIDSGLQISIGTDNGGTI